MRGWNISMPLHSGVSICIGHANQCALQVDGGTSYHIIVLLSYGNQDSDSLDPLHDARDRRGSECEWSRLNVVSRYHGFDPFAKAHISRRHNLQFCPIVRG